jgi:hypothetical protein
MYSNKLAVAIKTAGKVLREFEDQVYVPFGSEYSIFVKNLNSVRASVKISVDGEDVGGGRSFVVDANDSVDIERFIKNGNLSEGNRFKFIERTSSVENHRGIGIEDGLIRVEFQFEKPAAIWFNEPYIYNDPPRPFGYRGTGEFYDQNFFTTCDTLASSNTKGLVDSDSSNANYSADITCSMPVNDAGITVPGSISDQHFNEVGSFPLEAETHVIVLKLLGQTENNKVTKPVTVKSKPKCITCGRVNKANAKFCSNCGTALTIV